MSLSIRTLRRGFRQSVSQFLISVHVFELRYLYKHQRLTQLACCYALPYCRDIAGCAEMSVLVCHIVTSTCCRVLC